MSRTEDIECLFTCQVGGYGYYSDDSVQDTHVPPHADIETLIIRYIDRGASLAPFMKYLQTYYPKLRHLWIVNNWITQLEALDFRDFYAGLGLERMVVVLHQASYRGHLPVVHPNGFYCIINHEDKELYDDKGNGHYEFGPNYKTCEEDKRILRSLEEEFRPDNEYFPFYRALLERP